LVIDPSGTLYESDGNMIYKVDSSGNLIPFAGSDEKVGSKDGTGAAAEFNVIQGLTVDAAGNIYVADSFNNQIRKVTPAGVVTTVAGTGVYGQANGKIGQATFATPCGVALDDAGNIYVADAGTNLIRKIDISGNVTTIAGNGSAGNANGQALSASFNNPLSLVVDKKGNIYVSDGGNNQIRKISLQ